MKRDVKIRAIWCSDFESCLCPNMFGVVEIKEEKKVKG